MKITAVFILIAGLARAQLVEAEPTPYQQLGREIYKELIETDTTHSTGDTTKAAESLAHRFRNAGFADADVIPARALSRPSCSWRIWMWLKQNVRIGHSTPFN